MAHNDRAPVTEPIIHRSDGPNYCLICNLRLPGEPPPDRMALKFSWGEAKIDRATSRWHWPTVNSYSLPKVRPHLCRFCRLIIRWRLFLARVIRWH